MVRKRRMFRELSLTEVKDKFLNINHKIKLLKVGEEMLRKDLKKRMIQDGEEKLEGTGKIGGSATLCTRITTIYPDEVKEAIKELKEKAELERKVIYDTTKYIQVNWSKKKEKK